MDLYTGDYFCSWSLDIVVEEIPEELVRRPLWAEGTARAKVLRMDSLSSWNGKKGIMIKWRRQEIVWREG